MLKRSRMMLSEPSARIAMRCSVGVVIIVSAFAMLIQRPQYLASCALRTDRACLPEMVQFARLFMGMLLFVAYLAALAFRVWVRPVSICCLLMLIATLSYDSFTLLPALEPSHNRVFILTIVGRAIIFYVVLANLRDYLRDAKAQSWSETRRLRAQ